MRRNQTRRPRQAQRRPYRLRIERLEDRVAPALTLPTAIDPAAAPQALYAGGSGGWECPQRRPRCSRPTVRLVAGAKPCLLTSRSGSEMTHPVPAREQPHIQPGRPAACLGW
jgi:hypothetical protein